MPYINNITKVAISFRFHFLYDISFKVKGSIKRNIQNISS